MSEVILSLPRSGSTFYMQQRYRERVLNGEQIGFMHEFIWPHSKVRDYHWDNPPRLKSAKQHDTKDFENLIAGIYMENNGYLTEYIKFVIEKFDFRFDKSLMKINLNHLFHLSKYPYFLEKLFDNNIKMTWRENFIDGAFSFAWSIFKNKYHFYKDEKFDDPHTWHDVPEGMGLSKLSLVPPEIEGRSIEWYMSLYIRSYYLIYELSSLNVDFIEFDDIKKIKSNTTEYFNLKKESWMPEEDSMKDFTLQPENKTEYVKHNILRHKFYEKFCRNEMLEMQHKTNGFFSMNEDTVSIDMSKRNTNKPIIKGYNTYYGTPVHT